jgi:hypothetical protein
VFGRVCGIDGCVSNEEPVPEKAEDEVDGIVDIEVGGRSPPRYRTVQHGGHGVASALDPGAEDVTEDRVELRLFGTRRTRGFEIHATRSVPRPS